MAAERLRILVVEDNEYDYEIAERILNRSDLACDLKWVQHGRDALKQLLIQHYDLITLDYNLPDTTGLDVFREILKQGIPTPVIFVTGDGDEQIAVEALKSGAQDYFVKDPNGDYLKLLPTVISKVVIQWDDKLARQRAEKALRESEQRFRALATHAPVGIYESDADGNFIYVNESWSQVTGLSQEEAIGMGWTNTIHPDDAHEVISHWKQSIENGERPQDRNYRVQRPDGSIAWVHGSTTPFYGEEEQVTGFIGTIVDITERKYAEDVLKLYATELEARNQELDNYAQTISHDLKNPLGTMRFLVDLVLRYDDKDKQTETVAKIIRAIERMDRMIDQLLHLAKLRKAEVDMVSVDVNQIVQDTVEDFEVKCEEKNIALHINGNLTQVIGHAVWIEEIFANLIGNAVKYMNEDNTKPIIAVRGEQQGDFVRLEVQDNGVGIEPEDHEHLFEMFTRFNSHTENGFGLGLSIVKRLVSNMKGEMGVNSTPGEGSTFWFRLPSNTDGRNRPVKVAK